MRLLLLLSVFLGHSGNVVSYRSIVEYLKSYLNKALGTYNFQIKTLKRFVRDFPSFKLAPVDGGARIP